MLTITPSCSTNIQSILTSTSYAGGHHNMPPPPDLLTWCPSQVVYRCVNFNLPIGLCVVDIGPTYTTDRRQTRIVA